MKKMTSARKNVSRDFTDYIYFQSFWGLIKWKSIKSNIRHLPLICVLVTLNRLQISPDYVWSTC